MRSYKSRLDGIGIVAALICMAHCVLLPVAFSLMAFYQPASLESHWLEISLLGISLVIGSWAIWRGYQQFHQNQSLIWLFALGIALLVAGNLADAAAMEMALKFSATALLAGTHFYNSKKCKSCAVYNTSKELAES